jgi:hypothetical protein
MSLIKEDKNIAFNRKDFRLLFHKLYNENCELTMISNNYGNIAYLNYHHSVRKTEPIPFHICYELVRQNLVTLDNGNEYYGEENYVANKENIKMIASNISCDVGDTVICLLKDYEDLYYSGFITGWIMQELNGIYVDDRRIIPSKVMVTRRVLIEKIQVKIPSYAHSKVRID